MAVSVIVPHHKEELLGWTLDNIKRVAPDAEVIPMADDKCEGVGLMEHRGALKATNDVIVFASGHMNFSKQCFQRIEAEVKRNPKNVVCVDCQGIDPETLENNGSHRYGADLYEVLPGGTKASPMVFKSKWRRTSETKKTHIVPSVLGACYGVNKDWYFDGLGAPWQYHKGWGKLEQMLVLMNYYMGGECTCIPSVWASHLFKDGTKEPAVGVRNAMFFKRNSFLVLHGYVPEVRREQLLDTFCPPNRAKDYGITSLERDGSIKSIQSWIDNNAVKNYSDIREIMSKATPTTNYTATETPRSCPKCKSHASAVCNTYDLHTRKRVCSDCGNKYLTRSAILK